MNVLQTAMVNCIENAENWDLQEFLSNLIIEELDVPQLMELFKEILTNYDVSPYEELKAKINSMTDADVTPEFQFMLLKQLFKD